MKKIIISSLIVASFLNAEILVYGPGGPAPVIKELAKKFEEKTKEKVTIVAGPTSSWIDKAKEDADLIYSGNTSMMDDFIKKIPNLSLENLSVLNVRPSGIIVRPNNPKNIKNFEDILKNDVNIMVIDGAGQVGLYEDMALKSGKRENLVKLRKNIKVYAKNSKAAIDEWNNNQNIDVLIIWSHWAKALGEKALFIKDNKAVIYRAAEIIPTQKGLQNKQALEFVNFIQSKEAQKVWKEYTWKAIKK
ncbi:extracellular solute-binding protein [Campylobacter sp. TTU-622]|uniref:extracellular solute-binding protein n=1 Tax=Campylobacter sp. TTU-622 TaxID=2800583 RepID=UPI001906C9FE|nr:extracellular solute-binding protein [Campylobacter sp. TTU-622]MBK1973614.1 extracellular solute-binding protein [Campylobacter sp. TTU-622]